VGGPTSCGVVEPCGGNLVGTWTITTGCITGTGIKDAAAGGTCSGERVQVTGVNESGILMFNADMTYSITSMSEQATYAFTFPDSCVGGTCSDAAAALLSTGEYLTVSCTGTATCSCNALQTPQTNTESGTYTLAGTTLVTTSTTGKTTTVDYCVQGSYAHFIVMSTMSMGPMGQAAVDEDNVAVGP
jgi:hypothetical protein